MQDFFFVGIISAIALGVVLIKSILFIIHLRGLKESNEMIRRNQANIRFANIQTQQIQSTMSSVENVLNWKTDDARLTEDLKQQFLTKTKTRRTPTGEIYMPRERVPLATTDLGDLFNDDDSDENNSVPIYSYNPSLGGTQV